jgi:hypothetical protein
MGKATLMKASPYHKARKLAARRLHSEELSLFIGLPKSIEELFGKRPAIKSQA